MTSKYTDKKNESTRLVDRAVLLRMNVAQGKESIKFIIHLLRPIDGLLRFSIKEKKNGENENLNVTAENSREWCIY